MAMQDKSNAWSCAMATLAEDDAGYCRRRAAEERAQALGAYHPRVRQAHLDMAIRYEDLAHAVEAFDRHLGRKLEIVA